MDMPRSWYDLQPLLSEEWVQATAWAAAGGDPEGCEIRIPGGRVVYDAAWVQFGPRGGEKIRLSRVVSKPDGLREYVRWVRPDDVVEIRRLPTP